MESFTAAFTTASVNVDGDFTITGVSTNNTAILLTATPLANGSYDLKLDPTNNNGASYFDVQSQTNPFMTLENWRERKHEHQRLQSNRINGIWNL